MKFAKKPANKWIWFLLSLIPLFNLYWLYKVSKLLAYIDDEQAEIKDKPIADNSAGVKTKL